MNPLMTTITEDHRTTHKATLFVHEHGTHRIVGFCQEPCNEPGVPEPGVENRTPASVPVFLSVEQPSQIVDIHLAARPVEMPAEANANKGLQREHLRGLSWGAGRLVDGATYIYYGPEDHRVLPTRLLNRNRAPVGDDRFDHNLESDLAVLRSQLANLPPLQPGRLYPLHMGVATDTDFGAFERIPAFLTYWTLLVTTEPAADVERDDADGQPYKQIIRDAISMFDNHSPGGVVATYLRDAFAEAEGS